MIPIDNSVAGRVADIHHLMPRSGLHIVGRIVPSGAASADGAEGREPEDDQDRREPRARARPVPQGHPRRSGSRPSSPPTPRARRAQVAEAGDMTRAALAPTLAAKIYGLKILKKDVADARSTTPRASSCSSRKPKWASRNDTARDHHVRVRGAQHPGRALQGARRLRHQRRQHDQARKLHDRAAASRRRSSTPTSRAIRRNAALELALEELEFVSQPKSLQILGVYPAHRFRETFK